ncbi:MAG: ATP-binding cassette domain-containing protein [Bdellovibrionaceae bacterium]|nr:ATP-binding cassette domain-containing protein [Pseudobdellovibrionaceae bacterium]MBX3033215.1 ATP-binding cassette domain-containing protein [Pseudobdellovibrionaceae bacterium]
MSGLKTQGIFLRDRDVALGYPGRRLVSSLSGDYGRGDRWVVVGPNGAGKSTFLRAVLDPSLVQSGSRQCSVAPARIAWLTQMPKLSWSVPCTVREFLLASLAVVKSSWRAVSPADEKRVDEVLARVGLSDRAHQAIAQLSGGQAQKLLFGRALLLNAEILLLDEPFSAVDTASKKDLWALLEECRPRTLQILVLHDPFDIIAAQAPVLRLHEGHSHILTPEEFRRVQERNFNVVPSC